MSAVAFLGVDDLRHVAPHLKGGERKTAEKIIEAAASPAGLTKAQVDEAESLITRGQKRLVHTPRKSVDLGNIDGLTAMFDQALRRQTRPEIVIAVDRVKIFRFSGVDPAATALPGTIDVSHGRKEIWYGRVLLDKSFSMAREQTVENIQEAVAALLIFANDPLGTAKRSYEITGRCCFCDAFIEEDAAADEAAGYHEACTKRFGLKRKKAAAA